MVYSLLPQKVIPLGEVDSKTLSKSDILLDFNVRRKARVEHPGLCTEEYQRMMELVIRHLFNWDVETQKSNGVGLFAKILAWCLATEEQGQKSLHGHYLLYVENWNQVMNILQRRKKEERTVGSWTFAAATRDAKELFVNACSAQLFSDFEVGKALSEVSFFFIHAVEVTAIQKKCFLPSNQSKIRYYGKCITSGNATYLMAK